MPPTTTTASTTTTTADHDLHAAADRAADRTTDHGGADHHDHRAAGADTVRGLRAARHRHAGGRREARSSRGGWYYFARSGFHAACLDALDGVNFDVTLQRFAGMGWVDVASATGSGGDETVTFNGRYGIYRYLVTAVSGSGAYTLGFKRP